MRNYRNIRGSLRRLVWFAAAAGMCAIQPASGADLLTGAAPAASMKTSLTEAARPLSWSERESMRDDAARRSALRGFRRSLIPLLASQSLDAASSYGLRELNPVLAGSNGGFGARAVTVKFAAVGLVLGGEYLLVRKYPGVARYFSKLNWAASGATTAIAIHNFAAR